MDFKEYISTPEAAKILGISRIAVFKKIKNGQIRAQKIGRNFIINKSDLREFLVSSLSDQGKKNINQAVKRVVLEYGEALKLLGQE